MSVVPRRRGPRDPAGSAPAAGAFSPVSAEGSKPPDLAVEEARRALESEAAEAERETVAAESFFALALLGCDVSRAGIGLFAMCLFRFSSSSRAGMVCW